MLGAILRSRSNVLHQRGISALLSLLSVSSKALDGTFGFDDFRSSLSNFSDGGSLVSRRLLCFLVVSRSLFFGLFNDLLELSEKLEKLGSGEML